jgi:hypothetical protein
MCPITHLAASVPASFRHVPSSLRSSVHSLLHSPFPTGSLSPGGLLLCSLATNNSAIKSVGEGAAHAGTLPGTPAGFRRVHHGHGLSPVRVAGKAVKGPVEGGLDDEDEDVDDEENSDDASVSSYSDRWVPRSGTPGSFCLVVGLFGPLALVVSVEWGPRAAAVLATAFS